MDIIVNVVLGIVSFLIVTIGALVGILYKINDKRISNTDIKLEDFKKETEKRNVDLHDMIHNEVDKTRMELTMHQNKVDTSFRDIWEHLNKFTADTRESLGKIVAISENNSSTEKRLEQRLDNMETNIERKIDQLRTSLPKKRGS